MVTRPVRSVQRLLTLQCPRYKLTPAKLFLRPGIGRRNDSSGATDGANAGGEHDSENDDVLAPLAAGGPYGGVGDVGSDHSDFFCSELVRADSGRYGCMCLR